MAKNDNDDIRMPTDDEIAVIRTIAYRIAEPLLQSLVAAIVWERGDEADDCVDLARRIVAKCRPS